MKSISKILCVAAAFAALASPSLAADIFTSGAYTSDVPKVSRISRTGVYLKGDLGIANGDRDISRTIRREGTVNANEAALDDAFGNGDGTLDEAEKADIADAMATLNIPGSFNADNGLSIPLIGDIAKFGADDDFTENFIFGGEISYLVSQPGSRFGFEVGIGATFYGDNETVINHVGLPASYVGGTAASDFVVGTDDCSTINTCAGDTSHFGTQTGSLSVERNYDVDLVFRPYLFATDRLGLYATIGASVAEATAKFSNGPSGPLLNANLDEGLTTNRKDTDHSIGLVLGGGAQWWVTDRIVAGVDYTWKRHEFDFNADSGATQELGGGVDVGVSANDHVTVKDSVHAVKGRIIIKLD